MWRCGILCDLSKLYHIFTTPNAVKIGKNGFSPVWRGALKFLTEEDAMSQFLHWFGMT